MKGLCEFLQDGYSNADEILFYSTYISGKKSGMPVDQSFVTVTAASKAGLDVVEVGQKLKWSWLNHPALQCSWEKKALGRSPSLMWNLDTQICEDKESNQFQADVVIVEIDFKELCTKLFNRLVGLSVTRADWLFNQSLPQL